MSDTSYIFDSNTLSLYDMYMGKTIDQLLQGTYGDIVANFSDHQKDQYKFWLSLSNSQKEYITDQVYYQKGRVVANIMLYGGVTDITLEKLSELLAQNQIVNYKVLNDEYIQFTDINGSQYLVYGKYNSLTNQVLSHD